MRFVKRRGQEGGALTTGLMGAMQEEIRLMTESMVVNAAEQHIKRTFYRGTLVGQKVVVAESGIGKVNAALCSQFLITHFGVDQLIFVGTAGALNPELCVGDIIITERALEWDFADSPREPRRWYQADPSLVALAVKAVEKLGLRARVGSVLTGDQPVLELRRKQELWQSFSGDCVEMEGGAVAHVCSVNEVPFLIVRVISDLADESSFEQFICSFAKVAPLPAEVVIEMLKELR